MVCTAGKERLEIYHEITNRLEKAHLLRRIYYQKTTAGSPLHFGQLPVMRFILENDGCTQSDIAEKLQVSAACIATSTKRLEKKGLVTKKVSEKNLRCKNLSLTALGKKTLEECRKPFEEYDKYVFRNISCEELENARIFLDKLIYNMEEAIGENHSSADYYEIDKLIRKIIEAKEETAEND